MSFLSELRSTVNNYHAAVASVEKEMMDYGNKYARVYMPDVFNAELSKYIAKRDEAIRAGNMAVFRLVNEYKEKVKGLDVVNGAELTEDAALLKSALPLTKKDLEAIYDRNKGNNTMQLLVTRRAERDNINIERTYTTAADIISGIDRMSGYAKAAIPTGVYYDTIWANNANFDKITPAEVRAV